MSKDRDHRPTPPPHARRWRVFVPAAVVLVIWSLTTHGKYSDSGDEPHYLIVAESLFSDGDLDLANNVRDGDARWFGADDLVPGPHARVTRQGALWSTHDIGVPIAILPVYAAATRASTLVPDRVLARIRQTRGLFAYSLVSLSLIALTAWGASLLRAGLARVVPPGRAAVVALGLALSPPMMSHAFLVFPETLAMFVSCAVVWLLCLDRRELTPSRVLAVVLLVGLLPWLHRKYSLLEFGLIAVIVVRHWPWMRERPRAWLIGAAAAAVVPQALLHLWTIRAWGSIGGPQMLDASVFSAGGVARGALGLLFDRERGLVGHAPIFLIVPACVALTWRQTRWLLVPAALLYVPMAAFVVWGAGFSPAARYLVPLVPLAALPVALAFDHPIVRRTAGVLAVFQAALVAVLWNSPRLLWPKELGTNEALQQVPLIGPAWERALPSLLTGDSVAHGLVVAAAVAVVTVAIVMGARGTRRGRLQPA
jgi:hypothetical protein